MQRNNCAKLRLSSWVAWRNDCMVPTWYPSSVVLPCLIGCLGHLLTRHPLRGVNQWLLSSAAAAKSWIVLSGTCPVIPICLSSLVAELATQLQSESCQPLHSLHIQTLELFKISYWAPLVPHPLRSFPSTVLTWAWVMDKSTARTPHFLPLLQKT